MALHVTLAYIYVGLTVIQGFNTVGHVSIEAGRPVSIPCQYELQYQNNVKYLCRGSVWKDCSYEIKTNQANSEKYNISDDQIEGIVTFTFNNPQLSDSDFYWCNVERGGPDDGKQFQLSVTIKGVSALHVDSQWITGYIDDKVTILCKFSGNGTKQWCKLGEPRSCLINMTSDTSAPGVYAVTMSGLKTSNIGWYWCAFRDLQMPVFLHVTERPTTTTTTISTATPELTTVKSIHKSETKSVPDYLIGAIIALGLLIVIIVVALVIWFMLKRKVKIEASSPQHCGDEPLYTVVKRPTAHQNPCADIEMDILYSSVSFVKKTQSSSKVKVIEEDVVYSTLGNP